MWIALGDGWALLLIGGGGAACPAAAHCHLALPAMQAPRAAADVAPPQQGDDVYAYEPQPLEEGVRKHMLSVFVAGAPLLLWCLAAMCRAAGSCWRRGSSYAYDVIVHHVLHRHAL